MLKSIILASTLSGLALAAPAANVVERDTVTVTVTEHAAAATSDAWNAGGVTEWPIHRSCNATERAQLTDALREMETLAQHAKDHILRFGNSSKHYTAWFGDAPSAGPIGWYDRVINADRTNVLFRCDDPDGNCARFSNYAGHWRGSNATQETVICPRSFTGIRWPLSALCSRGYTVANSPSNQYFATDLLHRVFHVPRISEGVVEHYADEYPAMLELARTNPEEAVINSDTLQLFAVDVYGYDISNPGVGCTGEYVEPSSAGAPAATPTPAASSAASVATSAAAVVAPPASAASSAANSCHTHSDGFVHC